MPDSNDTSSVKPGPHRVQLRRSKGWRKPDNTVVVARPSRWGNPFVLGKAQVRMPALDGSPWEYEGRLYKTTGERHAFNHDDGHYTWHQVELATPEQIVELFRQTATRANIDTLSGYPRISEIVSALRGKNLACWCPLDSLCHADVLLELANREVQ